METKLQDALKKANVEVKKANITDPELKKIAFSKAVDFYLQGEKEFTHLQNTKQKADNTNELGFWTNLVSSIGIDEGKLKDVYSIKDKQIVLVISSIPGESKADKQRNLSALILLAYHNGLGYEWVSSGLIAEAAGHSKLYDTSKFAKNLKCNLFRSTGVKKGLKYKLSGPGLNEAKNLLANIIK
jgi:hypothetical protein